MKAERRHELKENDLIHAYQTARDYLDQNSKQVTMGVLVVAAAVVAVGFAVRSRAVAIESGWRRMAELNFDDAETGKASLAALATLTADANDKRFILDSLTRQGTEALRLAQTVPFPPDRDLNAIAETAFGRMLKEFGSNPLAFGLAKAGLATVAENKFVLDENSAHEQEARELLQAILDTPSQNGLPFQQVAKKRLDELDAVFAVVRFAQPPAAPVVPAEPVDAEVKPAGDAAAPDPGKAENVEDKTTEPSTLPDAP